MDREPMTLGEILAERRKAEVGRVTIPGSTEADIAFRRGYHQGFEEALRLVRGGVSTEDLIRHADRVEAWRESRPLSPCPPPPVFGRGDT